MIFKQFLIFFFASVQADYESFVIPTYGSALSSVIIDYSINYMMPNSPVINFMQVSEQNNTFNQLYIMNDVLYDISRKGGVYRIILEVDVLEELASRLANRKRYHTVVFVDSLQSFYKFFSHINLEQWTYSGKIIVAITLYHNDIYEVMTKIFEAFWSKHIVHVVVMFVPYASNYDVLLYTYYPFSKFYCERAIPIKLNQYSVNKFLMPIDYFPAKLSNFHGCEVSVVTFKVAPFMMYKQDKTGAVIVDGIDGIVLRVLAQQLNFNVAIYENSIGWGRVFDNGTVTGELKLNFNELRVK